MRVRLVPGTGQFNLDGRTLEAFFPTKVHQQLIKAPLVTVDKVDNFDIFAPTSMAAVRQAEQARCASRSPSADPGPAGDRPALKAGFLTRDPRVRSGTQSTASKRPVRRHSTANRSRLPSRDRLSPWDDCSRTDGFVEVANQRAQRQVAMALGSAAVRRLANSMFWSADRGYRPRSASQQRMLEAAVIAGVTCEGVDALHVGVLPTPAVAYLTGAYGADFGVMISASHNPMPDNGIKIFGPGGHKLDDATGDQIEEMVAEGRVSGRPVRRSAVSSIMATRSAGIWTMSEVRSPPLNGTLTVVVGCANGAASAAAPRGHTATGARVIAIHAKPMASTSTMGAGRLISRLRKSSSRRPISVSPTTMQIVVWLSTPPGRSSTVTDHGGARAGHAGCR